MEVLFGRCGMDSRDFGDCVMDGIGCKAQEKQKRKVWFLIFFLLILGVGILLWKMGNVFCV